MNLFSLLALAVGLSMDAFAVAVCKGLAMPKARLSQAAVVGLWFGGFQALMPLVGYLLGVGFQQAIQSVDHWVAFVLLGLIGVSMIREARSGANEPANASLAPRVMAVLAVATSIDALAVGVTFAFLHVPVLGAVCLIGAVTFALSMQGVWIGHRFGVRYKAWAELAGGIILILLGCKILLEHLEIF